MIGPVERVPLIQHRAGGYLTVPQMFRLNMAAWHVAHGFGCPPYLVGSALLRPDFRDVDLRLPMSRARGGTDLELGEPTVSFLNCAISDWLSAATGLPVDFQFQDEPEWASHDDEPRIPVGLSRG